MVITEWIDHRQYHNQLPLVEFTQISFNVNFVDVEIENYTENKMEEETDFHEESRMRIPFVIKKLIDRC